jgi:hypothetical protein
VADAFNDEVRLMPEVVALDEGLLLIGQRVTV